MRVMTGAPLAARVALVPEWAGGRDASIVHVKVKRGVLVRLSRLTVKVYQGSR